MTGEERLTSMWNDLQESFSSRPADACEQADALVAAYLEQLGRLEAGWDPSNEDSTREVVANLARYQAVFDDRNSRFR